jgi:hypothetical protein
MYLDPADYLAAIEELFGLPAEMIAAAPAAGRALPGFSLGDLRRFLQRRAAIVAAAGGAAVGGAAVGDEPPASATGLYFQALGGEFQARLLLATVLRSALFYDAIVLVDPIAATLPGFETAGADGLAHRQAADVGAMAASVAALAPLLRRRIVRLLPRPDQFLTPEARRLAGLLAKHGETLFERDLGPWSHTASHLDQGPFDWQSDYWEFLADIIPAFLATEQMSAGAYSIILPRQGDSAAYADFLRFLYCKSGFAMPQGEGAKVAFMGLACALPIAIGADQVDGILYARTELVQRSDWYAFVRQKAAAYQLGSELWSFDLARLLQAEIVARADALAADVARNNYVVHSATPVRFAQDFLVGAGLGFANNHSLKEAALGGLAASFPGLRDALVLTRQTLAARRQEAAMRHLVGTVS